MTPTTGTTTRRDSQTHAPIVLVLGPAGAGKSEIGARLAAALAVRFVDADSLHAPAARAKMAAGVGLTDADRGPWLDRVATVIADAHVSRTGLVVACSALKKSYRELLRRGCAELFAIELEVPADVLAQRLRQRLGHFVSVDLLPSQLRDFEPLSPAERGARLDGTLTPDAVVTAGVFALRAGGVH